MTLNDFWQSYFGEDISPFEHKLVMKGADVLTPEEPLFALFAVMARILHSTLGDAGKALLRFSPEMVANANTMIRSAKLLDNQLREAIMRIDKLDMLLARLAPRQTPLARHNYLPTWVVNNVGPVVTSIAVAIFCSGFVLATALAAR